VARPRALGIAGRLTARCVTRLETAHRTWLAVLACLGLLAGCCLQGAVSGGLAAPLAGKIVHRGLLDCFPAGLRDADGDTVFCEASAAVWHDGELTVASDKPVPGAGLSPVFTFALSETGPVGKLLAYRLAAPFTTAQKYEDMTLTPDRRYVIATTGFDRVKADSGEWDGFNTLLYWPAGREDEVRVISPVTRDGVTSSLGLREAFSDALRSPEFPDEVPYFKIESLAAIPGGTLLFGVREIGVHYEQFVYSFKIIEAPYAIRDGDFSFEGDFSLVYDLDLSALPPGLRSTALSSIEYDPFGRRLYLLTSYEKEATDEGLGGYLLTLSLEALRSGAPPLPVRGPDGEPLHFAHKAEAVAVRGRDALVIVHDDDRVTGREAVTDPDTQFKRAAHQAAYALVRIGKSRPRRPGDGPG